MTQQVHQHWIVQHTGWSGGLSWFDVMASRLEPFRHASEEEARAYVATHRGHDSTIKWRIVHVTIEQLGNKRVTTEVWTEL